MFRKIEMIRHVGITIMRRVFDEFLQNRKRAIIDDTLGSIQIWTDFSPLLIDRMTTKTLLFKDFEALISFGRFFRPFGENSGILFIKGHQFDRLELNRPRIAVVD